VFAEKNRQLSRWRFFYVRAPGAGFDEIGKSLLFSWTSARS